MMLLYSRAAHTGFIEIQKALKSIILNHHYQLNLLKLFSQLCRVYNAKSNSLFIALMIHVGVLTEAFKYTTFANANVLTIKILPFKERSLVFNQCNNILIDSNFSGQFFLSTVSF